MARVVIDVMLKPEILDPQGEAVSRALPRIGVDRVAGVRVGKRVELEFAEGVDSETMLEQAHAAAERLLSNPVIEDCAVRGVDEAESVA